MRAGADPGNPLPWGYELWLKFAPVSDSVLASQYRASLEGIVMEPVGATQEIAYRELTEGIGNMLSRPLLPRTTTSGGNLLVAATLDRLPTRFREFLGERKIPAEGFLIREVADGPRKHILLTAADDAGLLYGAYRLLRLVQTHRPLSGLDQLDAPKARLRMLNHWDNLDRSIERGYAGFSIFNWHTLPDFRDPRYEDYARANASLGINATAVTNVNANALVLTEAYIDKARALADIFRPYGIRLYLTARFSAPMEIGGLDTADPLDPRVSAWWRDKAGEIYRAIPDFGGFLVKANSEGQPGPQNYGRSHREGANMLADALGPFGGNVIWRAFVYSEEDPEDRAKQAYSEFAPEDGKFRDNVLLQVKNGPIDFQPREPIHPLFGAMPETPLLVEFQITKEYLGFATHLAFLPKLFEEVLQTDTYREGPGSTVARVVDGSLHGKALSGMAGVANIGTDINWTGHPFGQADWYGFGRLAWDPYLSSGQLAEEWVRATFGNDPVLVASLKDMMLRSREAVVNYMNPLGLHHLFDTGHHYGPGPWVDDLSRPEWNPVYYHQADASGIGFDRSATGSNAVAQYAPELATRYGSLETCPEEFLLWFHHVPWDYRLRSGHTLWEGLGLKYQEGVDTVVGMLADWQELESRLPQEVYRDVSMRLQIQLREARWWKYACMQYFRTFSGMDFPQGMEPPEHPLEYYKALRFPFAPGIRPRWN
ncbi:alpha-glucuronidase [Robiginitalea sp. SC105]|nr:alpha-glucuronidase [Robiginitalea sp. SC105]